MSDSARPVSAHAPLLLLRPRRCRATLTIHSRISRSRLFPARKEPVKWVLPNGAKRAMLRHGPNTIEFPDDVLSALPIPAGEREGRLRMEMACLMYGNGWVSLGKAAELARVDTFRLGQELAARGISMNYDEKMM